MRRSGRKGAGGRFSGVCLSGDGQKRNDSVLFSRRMQGARKAVGKRMTCPDFIFEMGARAHKDRMTQSCSRGGDEDET